jgi:hypothetical protein
VPLKLHPRPFGHGIEVIMGQPPLPSHVAAGVSCPFVHCDGLHVMPASSSAHVPSGFPVCAIVQPWQVLLHAALQHTPSAQKPVTHSSAAPHSCPAAFFAVQVPPLFVVSQKPPDLQSVSIAHAVQIIALQSPLAQSFPILHIIEFAHGTQSLPPQSTSVSSASKSPSMQCIETHVPLPSQITPLLSVQAVPNGALVVPHVWVVPVHVETLQSVVGFGQSVGILHPMHVPLPSQMFPPLSLQAVPDGAVVVPQALPMQVLGLQAVVGAGQSVGITHATHVPFPSHTLPPLSVHVVPALAFVVPQQPAAHVLVTHAVLWAVQSVATMQASPPSHPLDPPPLEVVLLLLEVPPPLEVVLLLLEVPPPPLEVLPPLPQPAAVPRMVAPARRNALKKLAILLISTPNRS